MPLEKFDITLQSTQLIAPTVRHLSFTRTDGAAFQYMPGQFINTHFDYQGEQLKRSYSLANLPDSQPDDRLELAIAYVEGGRASDYFFSLQPGDTLQASGPAGRLLLSDDNPTRYVFIATGTGIAPYRTMLPELTQRLHAQPNTRAHVLLGVRHAADQIYRKDFLQCAQSNPRLQFTACLSREQHTQASHEFLGRVTDFMPSMHLCPQHDIVYLCGNPAMVDEAFIQMKSLGFDHKRVKREKYIFGS